jgi:hypothetical protein
MKLTRRRALAIGAIGIVPSGVAAILAAPATAADKSIPTLLYEHAYFRAKPGQHDRLGRYILKNILEIDLKAIAAGLLTEAYVLDAVADRHDWNYIVVVGYPQADGINDPQTSELFAPITAAHPVVVIDDKTFNHLGKFVKLEKLRPLHNRLGT